MSNKFISFFSSGSHFWLSLIVFENLVEGFIRDIRVKLN